MTNTQTLGYAVGDRVEWLTGHVTATIVRLGHAGELVIRADGDFICATTRACFIRPMSVTR